jgi:hypothetical protein
VAAATDDDIKNVQNWNLNAAIPWSVIMSELFAAHKVSGPAQSRITGFFWALAQDTFPIIWDLKFLWDVARPNQLLSNFKTYTCTPEHPSYPAGHAIVSGALGQFLTYLFPTDKDRIDHMIGLAFAARVNTGVHYPVDCEQGNILGRQLAGFVTSQMSVQRDENDNLIDIAYTDVGFTLFINRNQKDNPAGCLSGLVDLDRSRAVSLLP